jgi:hypothetical protein
MIKSHLLKIRLLCRGIPISPIVAGLLWLAGTSMWLVVIPYFKSQYAHYQQQIQQAQTRLYQAPVNVGKNTLTVSEQRLQQFYRTLGETHYVEQQVDTLIALAHKNGLDIIAADYQFAENKPGLFNTYTVTMPIQGPYAMVRQFCNQALIAIPFATLDELSFKRSAIANQIIETRVRFILYLDINAKQRRSQHRTE